MIQPTFDMIPRALLVLFIIHIVMFVCDIFHKRIVYTVLEEGGDTLIYLDENELFPTKEELLKSL